MTTAPTLFTLPPHLRENIASLVTASIAPEELQVKMRDALAAAEVEEMEETLEAEPATRPEKDDNEENAEPTERLHPPPPQRKPPTIDGELLDELSSWAATPAAGAALKSSGLSTCLFFARTLLGILKVVEILACCGPARLEYSMTRRLCVPRPPRSAALHTGTLSASATSTVVVLVHFERVGSSS